MSCFKEDEIKEYAFPAIIEDGRRCFVRGKVSGMHFLGNDIIAHIKEDSGYKVVLSRHPTGKIHFDCTCDFHYGGACSHVVATMLAANAHQAIQVGFDLNTPQESPKSDENAVGMLSQQANKPEHVASALLESSEVRNNRTITVPPDSPPVIEMVGSKPKGRLYLSERESILLIELRFAYAEGRTEFTRTDPNTSRLIPAEGKVYRVVRSKARETSLTATLAEFELIQYQTGFFTPYGDSRQWVLNELPRIAREGFEVYGKENLRTSKATKSTPKLAFSVNAKGKSLDCTVSVSFDGISAHLASLIYAVREKSRFVMLSDGSSGMLPTNWLERFAALLEGMEGKPNGDSLTVKSTHIGVVDMFYDMADESHGDAEFHKKRESLRNFRKVEKQPLPDGFACTMRPYQQAGYEWFYFLKKYRFGGCLADDMGLGKTVQTLALLLNEKNNGARQPALVVLPTSLLFNWNREAGKFAPGLSILIYHGPNRHRYVRVLHMANVILTSYGTVLRDLEILKGIPFHYLILDEAQAIKNPGSRISRVLRQLPAANRLALSGTPIENNLAELWSIFSFLNPGMLGSYRHFAQHFVKPIERDQNENIASVLRKIIFPFILRRTKEQVAKDLPPKNEMVVYADMLPQQKTLYNITKDTYRSKIAQSLDNEGFEQTRFQMLEGLLRLRQICCHPRLVNKNFAGDSGKFCLMDESIEEIVEGGHRVLLFSQFVRALELFRTRLTEKGIKSELLTGSTRNRAEVVDRFQEKNSAPVFLISLKAGGCGLNLTAADYVIHIDPWWNPSIENQASDRAYRIGQTRPVFVYKMITRDSIEERVLELQERKKALVQSIIQTESSFFKELNKDDIMELFS